MYRPSELREFLQSLGIKPKKGLSQNFLIDGNIVRKIVRTAHVVPGDIVMEIGPGPGALTQILLEAGAQVIAVEKDEVLAHALKRLDGEAKNLKVYCSDILEFPLEECLKPLLKEGQRVKVIANLPYHLTTPILTQLVVRHDLFSHLVLMVQDEVARRFTARPKTAEYGSISVFLNYHSRPHYAFRVSHNCFYPKPSVESAIVDIELKEPPKVSSEECFFDLTRTAFEHRRKMLRGSLKELYSSEVVVEALEEIGLNPQARPEDLSLQDWLQLYGELDEVD